jgi:hypothetical protein
MGDGIGFAGRWEIGAAAPLEIGAAVRKEIGELEIEGGLEVGGGNGEGVTGFVPLRGSRLRAGFV